MNDTIEVKVRPFHFKAADGSKPRFEMDHRNVGFTMRVSAAGRRVLVFPAPYTLEITEGERVGAAKMALIDAAMAELKARKV